MLIILKKKNLFLLGVIGLLIIFLHYSRILNPLENLIIRGLNPTRKQVYQLSRNLKSYFHVITNYNEIRTENIELKNKLADYIVNLSHIQQLEQENAVLKQELNYFKTTDQKLVLAEVISGFYLDGDNLLVINRGQKDGVNINMPVVFSSGIIVGKIIKANDYSSIILLLSDKNSLVAATIQGNDITNGIIKGGLDYGLQMDYIPADIDINIGDIVITSGLEEKIPKGLVIGQIKELIFESGDFFKTAIVYSLVDYQTIDFVNVILD